MKSLKVIVLAFLLFIGAGSAAKAHVALDYPVGGETFNQGDTVNVQWHIVIPHDLQNWDLYFSDDGGATWQVIELDLPPPQLNYNWVVPGISTTQGRIRIYMDNTGVDYEDQSDDFTILTVTIPTLSEWGMIILALLLLAAGTIGIIRRRKTAIKKAV
jgi:hypothetical protein